MGGRIAILMYHQVGNFPTPRSPRAIHCHHERFAAQMAFLHRFSYNVVSMDRVVEMLSGKVDIPSRTVALTFDDGYESFGRYAFPVLQRYGFPAIVYLVSGLVGRRARWLTRAGPNPPMLMDAGEIRRLRRDGIDFGAHGVRHVRLTEVGRTWMQDELHRSKEELEDLLGEEIRHLCYPYGSHDSAVVEAARAAGYHTAVTCVRDLATCKDDPLALPRKTITYGDNVATFHWKLRFRGWWHARPYQPGNIRRVIS